MKVNHHYDIAIFNSDYYVCVVFGDDPTVHRIALRHGHQLSEPNFNQNRGVTFITEGCYPVIGMPRVPKTPTEYATLGHEACHAVEFLFESIGQPIGGEVFAHSVGAVIRESVERANRKISKPKPRIVFNAK